MIYYRLQSLSKEMSRDQKVRCPCPVAPMLWQSSRNPVALSSRCHADAHAQSRQRLQGVALSPLLFPETRHAADARREQTEFRLGAPALPVEMAFFLLGPQPSSRLPTYCGRAYSLRRYLSRQRRGMRAQNRAIKASASVGFCGRFRAISADAVPNAVKEAPAVKL